MDPEARLRTMRIIWAVFLTTVGLYALVAYFAAPSTPDGGSVRTGEALGIGAVSGGLSMMLIVFFALGFSMVVISFLLKLAFTNRAVRERNPALLQTGLILSLVLCEMAGLLAFIGLFADGNRNAYLLFGFSALGILLHFPRREQVFESYGKGETAGTQNF